MNLKFIGTDGSMGLKHGEVYDTSIVCTFHDEYITVKWLDHDGVFRKCPYSSPAAFAANWAKPGQPQKVVVRKKSKTADPVKHGYWIPVSERLPEPYTPVLTCRQEANSGWRYICMDKVIFQNGNEDEPIWIGDMRWTESTITYWMSLPECPWGGEKNKYEL